MRTIYTITAMLSSGTTAMIIMMAADVSQMQGSSNIWNPHKYGFEQLNIELKPEYGLFSNAGKASNLV